MKTFGILALALTICGSAHAETQGSLKKILDGAVRTCNGATQNNSEKQVQMGLRGSNEIVIRMVKCEIDERGVGHYVLDEASENRSRRAVNGELIQEAYTNFELVLVDKDSKVLETHALNSLGKTSEEVVRLNGQMQKDTDLFVRAIHSYQSESGIGDRGVVAWGSYRY